MTFLQLKSFISTSKKKKTSGVPVSLFSCSPNAMTGRAEAKKIYAVGANILLHWLTRLFKDHRDEWQ